MIQNGDKVKAMIDLKSDDRELGMEDGTPIILAGAIGTVLGRSEEFLEEDEILKEMNCWVVDWGIVNFDTSESEMEKV